LVETLDYKAQKGKPPMLVPRRNEALGKNQVHDEKIVKEIEALGSSSGALRSNVKPTIVNCGGN
jgi:hypothetical protein